VAEGIAVVALLTAALSLDGAVVVMVPVVLTLVDRGAPARPLLLATIGVANAFSIAVVQGNPTNLVVMTGLHLRPAEFDATMLGPGTAVAAAALVLAGIGESLAPAAGVAPWWPACGVALAAAAALGAAGVPLPRPTVPWRIGLLVTALATALGTAADASGLVDVRLPSGSVWALLAVTVAAAAVAAVVNNLPAAVAAGALLHTGPAAFAVLSGVSVGALAGARGSVATLLVRDLAGPVHAPAIRDGYLRLCGRRRPPRPRWRRPRSCGPSPVRVAAGRSGARAARRRAAPTSPRRSPPPCCRRCRAGAHGRAGRSR
jgi:hypothetical protein